MDVNHFKHLLPARVQGRKVLKGCHSCENGNP
jgi:hypothetical protein